jgi:NitT/TauT family transport system substrate-binding protein
MAAMKRGRALKLGIVAALASTFAMSSSAAESITFATDWKAEAEHGGFYQALAKGFYAREGLDVRIRQGGPQLDNQQLIAAGALDFAMASNSFYALNLLQAGADATVVMASFQKDPQILMTHPRDDISSIADMKGKPIMIGSSAVNTFWAWLKSRFGFEDSQIRKYTFNLAPWLIDKNAIQEGYLSSEPFLAIEQGVTPKVFLLADEGYPGYSAMIMVQNHIIRDHPEIVQAFVNATIDGWRSYLYEDPAPGNALIKKDNPEMTDALLAYAIDKLRSNGIVDSGDSKTLGIGAMTAARWNQFYTTMRDIGVYPAGLDVSKAYTTRFVNKGRGVQAGK